MCCEIILICGHNISWLDDDARWACSWTTEFMDFQIKHTTIKFNQHFIGLLYSWIVLLRKNTKLNVQRINDSTVLTLFLDSLADLSITRTCTHVCQNMCAKKLTIYNANSTRKRKIETTIQSCRIEICFPPLNQPFQSAALKLYCTRYLLDLRSQIHINMM